MRSGLDIQRLQRGGGPQTTVPLDDTSPRAVVQVHVIQEQKKDGCKLHLCSIFVYTPEKARQKYRHGGKQGGERVEEAHTKGN